MWSRFMLSAAYCNRSSKIPFTNMCSKNHSVNVIKHAWSQSDHIKRLSLLRTGWEPPTDFCKNFVAVLFKLTSFFLVRKCKQKVNIWLPSCLKLSKLSLSKFFHYLQDHQNAFLKLTFSHEFIRFSSFSCRSVLSKLFWFAAPPRPSL